MAEGVFREVVEKAGFADRFQIDSAGTGNYHVGELPDPRSIEIAAKYGITLDHIVRQLNKEDFDHFDYIVGMDLSNRTNILKLIDASDTKAEKVHLMLDFVDELKGTEIADPYHDELPIFDTMYHTMMKASKAMLEKIQQNHPDVFV